MIFMGVTFAARMELTKKCKSPGPSNQRESSRSSVLVCLVIVIVLSIVLVIDGEVHAVTWCLHGDLAISYYKEKAGYPEHLRGIGILLSWIPMPPIPRTILSTSTSTMGKEHHRAICISNIDRRQRATPDLEPAVAVDRVMNIGLVNQPNP